MNATVESRNVEGRRPSGRRDQGTIRWFNTTLGYGFISVAPAVKQTFDIDPEFDLFFHGKELKSAPFPRRLDPGQPVEFTVAIGKKGPCATRVEIIP